MKVLISDKVSDGCVDILERNPDVAVDVRTDLSREELVEVIGRVCGREVELERLPLQPGDVLVTYADVSKAREMLGYDPSTTVEQGVERFVRWYHETHGGAVG